MKITLARTIVGAIAALALYGSLPVVFLAAALSFGMSHFKSMESGSRWNGPEMTFHAALLVLLAFGLASVAFFPHPAALSLWHAFCAAGVGYIVVAVWTKFVSSSNPFSRM